MPDKKYDQPSSVKDSDIQKSMTHDNGYILTSRDHTTNTVDCGYTDHAYMIPYKKYYHPSYVKGKVTRADTHSSQDPATTTQTGALHNGLRRFTNSQSSNFANSSSKSVGDVKWSGMEGIGSRDIDTLKWIKTDRTISIGEVSKYSRHLWANFLDKDNDYQ